MIKRYSYDIFGRTRVSTPYSIFEAKQTESNLPLIFDDQQVSGSNTTSVYNRNRASVLMTVSLNNAGRRIRQTFRSFHYQPGKSQRIFFTGKFNNENVGLLIRSSVGGGARDTIIPRSQWNIDQLNGDTDVPFRLDLTKSQLMFIEFGWLGGAGVAFGFIFNDTPYYCHLHKSSNIDNGPYMSSPNLPVRYEIKSNGSGRIDKYIGLFSDANGVAFTSWGSDTELEHTCVAVQSEGGQDENGIVMSINTDNVQCDANVQGTRYAVLGIRLKSANLRATVQPISATIFGSTANDNILWELILNPTVAGTFAYSDVNNSVIQRALGATANTVTGGTVIDSGYTRSQVQATLPIKNTIFLGSSIAGVSDTLVICATPVAGSNNLDVYSSLTWRELL